MRNQIYAANDKPMLAPFISRSLDVGKGHSKRSARESFTHSTAQAKIRSRNRARYRPGLLLNASNSVPVDPARGAAVQIRHVANRGMQNRNMALEQEFCIRDEQLLSSNPKKEQEFRKKEQEFRKKKRELSRPKSKDNHDEMTPEVLGGPVMIFGDDKQLEYPSSPLDSASDWELKSMAENKPSLYSEAASPPAHETTVDESQRRDTEMPLCQAKMSTRVPSWVYCISGAKGPIAPVIHERGPEHLPAFENEATPWSLATVLFNETQAGAAIPALQLLAIATEYHQRLTSQTPPAATHQTPSRVGDHADCVVADVPATTKDRSLVPVSPTSLPSLSKRDAELRWLMSKALPMPPPLALGSGIRCAPAKRSP